MWITFLKGPLNFNPLWLKVFLKILCKTDFIFFANYWVINIHLMPNKPDCQKNSFLSHFSLCTIVWMTYHSILSLLQILTWDMKYITYVWWNENENQWAKQKKLMKVVMCEVCNVSKDEYACKKYFITKWNKMIMITKQIENLESEWMIKETPTYISSMFIFNLVVYTYSSSS